MITENDKKLLIELISNEQIHRHKKCPDYYESDEYKHLEELKVKIKDMD